MAYVGLGSTASGDVFSQYGTSTARGVVARIRRLPVNQRATALKAVMAKLDPSLQARAEKYANAEKGQGAPSSAALERGLARAMSEGVVTELAKLGVGGVRPAPSSLLGLGIDSACSRQKATRGNYVGLGALSAAVSQASSAVNTLPTATVKPPIIKIGPFRFPSDANKDGFAVQFNSPAELARLPEDQKAFIRNMLVKGAGDDGPWHPINFATAMMPLGGKPMTGARELLPWLAALGLPPDAKYAQEMIWGADPHKDGISADSIADHKLAPIATFDRPTKLTPAQIATLTSFGPVSAGVSSVLQAGQIESDWGIFLSSPGNRGQFYLWYVKIPKSGWWHNLGRWIEHLPFEIAEAVGDVAKAIGGAIGDAVKWVADETCSLVGAAAPLATAPAPGPGKVANPQQQAVAGGIAIANKLCGNSGPPLPPMMPPPSHTLLYVLLAGGALIGAIALTKGDD